MVLGRVHGHRRGHHVVRRHVVVRGVILKILLILCAILHVLFLIVLRYYPSLRINKFLVLILNLQICCRLLIKKKGRVETTLRQFPIFPVLGFANSETSYLDVDFLHFSSQPAKVLARNIIIVPMSKATVQDLLSCFH